jgi:hypothetical protein
MGMLKPRYELILSWAAGWWSSPGEATHTLSTSCNHANERISKVVNFDQILFASGRMLNLTEAYRDRVCRRRSIA